nr:translation initiation factor IF-2 isoform X4 [Drosophila suzukii]XP_036673710.1 translation initiation factor IF-2 isoform X4 [Drosophila suzukii]
MRLAAPGRHPESESESARETSSAPRYPACRNRESRIAATRDKWSVPVTSGQSRTPAPPIVTTLATAPTSHRRPAHPRHGLRTAEQPPAHVPAPAPPPAAAPGPGAVAAPVRRLRRHRSPGGADVLRTRPRPLRHGAGPRGPCLHGHPLRQAAPRGPALPQAGSGGALARRPRRHTAFRHLRPRALRVLPGLLRRGDLEPQHQCVRGLPLHKRLGAGQGTPSAWAGSQRGRAREWQTGGHGPPHPQRQSAEHDQRPANSDLDLWRWLHDRICHSGHLQCGHHGRRGQCDSRLLPISSGCLWIPAPGTGNAIGVRGGGARQCGPLGSGTGHSLAEGQRPCLRRKSGVDDPLRGVGGIQFGERAAHVAGDQGPGQEGHDAVGHHERPLEPHDLREGRGDRQGADQRL